MIMEKFSLKDMTKGWFVGDFVPNVIRTKNCEVGVKNYASGTKEAAHYHKEAEELTLVISGRIRMNSEVFEEGDIIKVLRDEIIEFEALEDAVTVVYKSISVVGDKYLAK